MKRAGWIGLASVAVAAALGGVAWKRGVVVPTVRVFVAQVRHRRPYGMAPEAWRAYLRACYRAHVSPWRVTQTIGEDARSKGYHQRDGQIRRGGRCDDFCAATDLHVGGLNPGQIARLLRALGKQGFAAWYRHEGKWAGDEHIHAVYALLPMKPQLREQVRVFLHECRAAGAVPRWAHKLKRRYRGAASPYAGPT